MQPGVTVENKFIKDCQLLLTCFNNTNLFSIIVRKPIPIFLNFYF